MGLIVVLDSAAHSTPPPTGGGGELSPFERDRGEQQQRIGSTAIEGSFAYQLGHDGLETGLFNVGDSHQIEQTVTLSPATKLVRLTVHLKEPESIEVGFGWNLSILFNSTTMYTRQILPRGRSLTLTDIIWPIGDTNRPATDVLAVKLEVV
jgi:hypothetical protein